MPTAVTCATHRSRPYPAGHPWRVMPGTCPAGEAAQRMRVQGGKRQVMPAEFTMGARASCIDGFCGEVRRTILDPAAGTITHLVVEHRHPRGEPGRLVPVGLASVTEGEIRLSCTLAEFGRLDPAKEVDVLNEDPYAGSQDVGVGGFGNVGSFGMGG